MDGSVFNAFVDIVTPFIIAIFSFIMWGVKTTTSRVQKTLDDHANDLSSVKIDLATLMEWRKGHDIRHNEANQILSEMRTFMEDKFRYFERPAPPRRTPRTPRQ